MSTLQTIGSSLGKSESIGSRALTLTPEELDTLGIPDLETIKQATHAALQKLTDLQTPRAIAHYFRDEQIHGRRKDALECPVANYLEEITGYTLVVQPNQVAYVYDFVTKVSTPYPLSSSINYSPYATPTEFEFEETRYNRATIDLFELPPVIQHFVKGFDHCNYPYLDIDRNKQQ